jgi:rhamnosyltransferase
MPSCSIIIRAFNEEKHIGRLLAGITQQTTTDVQTILVDSGSTDSTVQIARKFDVELVQIQPDDFTFGRSLNLGISHATADVVVIASAHVYPVYPDWLEHLLAPFSDPQVAVVYGKQRGTSTTKFSEHQIFHHWFPDVSIPRQLHPFCNNANAAIRRTLWLEHPFDESLPGLEDLGWARWVLERGFYISYVAEAEIVHVHNESWPGIYNRYRREGMAFKQIYPHEHFRLSDLFRLFTTNVFSDIRAVVHEGRFLEVFGELLRFRWLQFWGTYRGYRQSGPLTWPLKEAFYYPHSNFARPPVIPRVVQPIRYEGFPDSNMPGRSPEE